MSTHTGLNKGRSTTPFTAFLKQAKSAPFKWGSNDCCLFAANAVLAITGADLADDFRGKYTDEASAFALIKTVTGGTTVADAAAYCAKKHNLTEYTHPLMAKRADLVVISNAGNLIAGVVHLNGREVVSVNDQGIVRLPITSITRSWSI
jgi:hypothetical protein